MEQYQKFIFLEQYFYYTATKYEICTKSANIIRCIQLKRTDLQNYTWPYKRTFTTDVDSI